MKRQRMYNFLRIIVCILCAALNPQMVMQVRAANSIEITSQPSDAIGVIGETITLSVSASGKDLQYSWLYNYEGEYGLDVSYLEMSEFNNTGNKATMKILLTDFLTWGVFWCRITDANGNQIDTRPCRITLNKNGSLPDSTELAGPSPENGGGNVIWDCIWFGTYPQSEVTGSALTNAIKNADYNALNDASVGNARYRRLKCGDTYRYFLYEPIKWRVLEERDGKVLMLSDMLLDEHDYRYVAQFLNGYKEPAKLYTQGLSAGIDNFKDTAFNSKEQAAIVTEEIDAERENSVFSLERSDLNELHGFVDILFGYRCKEWTRAQISHYTRVWLDKNCENNPDKIYYGDWWLNTITEGTNVYQVSSSGYVSTTDYTDVWGHNKGIRPALWLNLDNAQVWQYAGIVKSADKDRSLTEESMTEIPCKISGGNDRKEQIIQVSATEVKMAYGESGVSVNAIADGDLDYYSANSSVVGVSENGTLTAVKPGETTITILAGTTAQYNSTVLEIPVRVVKAEAGLSVVQGSMELTVGDKDLEWGQIIVTTQSNAELQYEALDDSVVSTGYTGGRVRGCKQGQTKVRVFQRENEYYNAAEAYVDVKVNRGKSEIIGAQSSYTVNRKDKKITISFRKKGNNKTKATVSDSSIAYISRSPYQPKPQYEAYAYADYQLDVAVRKGGVVTITITNEENDQYEGSSISLTLTVVDDNQDDEEPLYDGDEITVENHNYTVLSATKCTLLYSGPTSRNVVSVKIPNVVTVDDIEYRVVGIGDNAFKNCKKLKKVTLPKSITFIGAKAFYKNTFLTQITIPAKVTKIGAQAFYGCKKLKKVTLKTSKLTSKSVGAKAFKGIAGNATIKVPKNKLKTYQKLLKKKGITEKKQQVKS